MPKPHPDDDFFASIGRRFLRYAVSAVRGTRFLRYIVSSLKTRRQRESEVQAAREAQAARIKSELAAQAPDQKPRAVVLPVPFTTEEQRDAPVRCPRCGSKQVTAHPENFKAGLAGLGLELAGPIGLGLGSGSDRLKITCLKCGEVFQAGEGG